MDSARIKFFQAQLLQPVYSMGCHPGRRLWMEHRRRVRTATAVQYLRLLCAILHLVVYTHVSGNQWLHRGTNCKLHPQLRVYGSLSNPS
jgi:hypothetical protein